MVNLPIDFHSLQRLLDALENRPGEKWAVMGIKMTHSIDDIIMVIGNGTTVEGSDVYCRLGG